MQPAVPQVTPPTAHTRCTGQGGTLRTRTLLIRAVGGRAGWSHQQATSPSCHTCCCPAAPKPTPLHPTTPTHTTHIPGWLGGAAQRRAGAAIGGSGNASSTPNHILHPLAPGSQQDTHITVTARLAPFTHLFCCARNTGDGNTSHKEGQMMLQEQHTTI